MDAAGARQRTARAGRSAGGMTNMRVWFNQTSAVTLFVVQSLRAQAGGFPLTVICSHRDRDSPLLQAADQWVVEPPDQGSEQYVDWALGFCVAQRIDVFVPRRELAAIVAHADAFAEAGTTLLVASLTHFDALDDKARAYSDARALGIPVPEHTVVRGPEAYLKAFRSLEAAGHEVCHKPRRDVGGAGFRRVVDCPRRPGAMLERPSTTTTLEEVLMVLSEGLFDTELVVSEYLPGEEFSADCLAWQGQLLGCVVRLKRGSHLRWILDRPDLVEYVRVLTAHYRLSYVFNVQFRGPGCPRFLEINPRPSAGLHQSAAIGYLWEALRMIAVGSPRPVSGDTPRLVASLPGAVTMRDIAARELPTPVR